MLTDLEGKFQIEAAIGDTICSKYVGYEDTILQITGDMDYSEEVMLPVQSFLGEVAAGIVDYAKTEHILYLRVVDENGKPIDKDDVYIERIWTDENGEEQTEWVSEDWNAEDNYFIIDWHYDSALRGEDGNPLKEAKLRIEVDGCDNPQTIKVKYPKRNTKKTIKFKHDKNY